MVKSEYSQDLFTPSGCLTLDAINRYHDNRLRQRELQVVKAHLEDCEICSDAVEGYQNLPDRKKQHQILLTLRRKIKSKYSAETFMGTGRRERKLSPRLAYISAAATILIILGIYGIINTDIFQQDNRVAEQLQEAEESKDLISRIEEPTDESIGKSVPETTESVEISKQLNDKQEEMLADEEIVVSVVDDMPEERILELDVEEEPAAEVHEIIEVADTLVIDGIAVVGGVEDKAAAKESISGKAADVAVKSEPIDWEKAARKTKGEQMDSMKEIQSISMVDELPVFSKIGYDDFEDFVQKNLKYPPDAITKGISGEVKVYFVVTENGMVEDIEIKVGIDSLLDKEAIRVINSSPRWKPGKKNGRKVSVKLEHVVTFK